VHIGLIGGIGPAATDYYYRRLIAAFARAQVPLELTIAHADTPTLLANLAADDKAAQTAIYVRLTERLARAGAECVAVTSIAGHFCIEAFEPVSALPVVDMIQAVSAAIAERGLKRIGLLGTRTVMQTRFYGAIHTAEIVPPADIDAVHDAYVAMAAAGTVTQGQRDVFDAACRDLLTHALVDAVMLGGTDLALAYDAATAPFPLVDCAGVHVEAITALAMGL
jgi:aspartate racemase